MLSMCSRCGERRLVLLMLLRSRRTVLDEINAENILLGVIPQSGMTNFSWLSVSDVNHQQFENVSLGSENFLTR